ncbi:MAG: hypothetical protein EGR46_01850, partial [Ruminococcus sp.]|uniref:hypothetical protein n=1 Tax=Ruminococcus sp. TaxID=41978 RepID=UPI0025ED67B8
VVVPFFTTIFKEEAKSLAVPNITIKLPNGQTLATSATKGFATGAKSTVSSIIKATATATVKTKVIAVVCVATILAGTSAVGISILAGCNAEKEPTEPSIISSTVQTSTVSSEVSKAIEDNGLKIDKDGNITDKDGKKVEVKDGKVEVKTDDGKTVTVKADEVKTTVSSNENKNTNKGNTEKKEETSKTNTSSSKTDTKKDEPKETTSKSDKNSENSNDGKTWHDAVYKYYKHHDAVTVYHDAVTKHHDAEWVVTGTHEEDLYGWVGYNVCNDCGKKLLDDNQLDEHIFWELEENGGRGSYHHEKEYVKTGTKTVEDGHWKEAYDEVITPAWTETITPAYDEEVSSTDKWDRKELVRPAGRY